MRAVDIIAHKRDGGALDRDAIAAFVEGAARGTWPDYQLAALLMAIVLRGMDAEETWALTEAMRDSGDRVDLSDVAGTTVGKHSTGGVGDKVSIIAAPLAAACGVVVPKMSGRGLGHTGGTLDKLESIPGFRIHLDVAEFKAILRDVGTCIIGQTASLAPADKALYALRDVTATTESLPLVASSVMSKKLAEGSSALVLDVKCGDGALVRERPVARRLAQTMVDIGRRAGVRTEALVTAMDAPLGRAVGNALEVAECLDVLEGGGPADVRDVAARVAGRMLVLGGVASGDAAAAEQVARVLASGAARERLARMVERQGGDPRVLDDRSRLPRAPSVQVLPAPHDGFVTATQARPIGRATVALGAGRAEAGDRIDHAVGVVLQARVGDRVSRGQPLVELHHREGRGLDEALALCRQACAIGGVPPPPGPLLLDEVR
ncbi:MAG: thymidine phosphorylase [Acidimicrobiia bacterium]|nr:thymidine phosphorylase [Acidimicrobiia bacterium]